MPSLKLKQKQKLNFEAIGTAWQIDIDTPISLQDFEKIQTIIKGRIEEFDKNYSRFRKDSLITKISRSKGSYVMPDDFPKLYKTNLLLNKTSNGLLTPLIGQVLVDAGYDSTYSLTQSSQLSQPPQLSQSLKFQGNTLTTHSPLLLDFGATGKGYLVDIISKLLEKQNIHSYCVDAGGDIYYQSEDKTPLRVGLEHPLDPTMAVGVAQITNQSICGSAGNRRAWGEYHHTINPFTLKSPDEIIAVWTIADNALLADGLTTCLYLDPHIKNYGDFKAEYVIMYKDGSVRKSPGFDGELFT